MAPEVEDTSSPKTNRVDIWSLGCIMYQMLAGGPLFNSRREVWRYSDSASSPPQAVRNRGFSVPCENFLGDVLQPEPRDRPSAEDCLKKPWITNKAPGLGYSIGSDLYRRLNKILRAAPDTDSFSDMVADRAVDDHLREFHGWNDPLRGFHGWDDPLTGFHGWDDADSGLDGELAKALVDR